MPTDRGAEALIEDSEQMWRTTLAQVSEAVARVQFKETARAYDLAQLLKAEIANYSEQWEHAEALKDKLRKVDKAHAETREALESTRIGVVPRGTR